MFKKPYRHVYKQDLWSDTKIRIKISAPNEGIYADALRLALNSIRREYDKINRHRGKI